MEVISDNESLGPGSSNWHQRDTFQHRSADYGESYIIDERIPACQIRPSTPPIAHILINLKKNEQSEERRVKSILSLSANRHKSVKHRRQRFEASRKKVVEKRRKKLMKKKQYIKSKKVEEPVVSTKGHAQKSWSYCKQRSKSFTFGQAKSTEDLFLSSASSSGLSDTGSNAFQPYGPEYTIAQRFHVVDKTEISQQLSGTSLVDYTQIDSRNPTLMRVPMLFKTSFPQNREVADQNRKKNQKVQERKRAIEIKHKEVVKDRKRKLKAKNERLKKWAESRKQQMEEKIEKNKARKDAQRERLRARSMMREKRLEQQRNYFSRNRVQQREQATLNLLEIRKQRDQKIQEKKQKDKQKLEEVQMRKESEKRKVKTGLMAHIGDAWEGCYGQSSRGLGTLSRYIHSEIGQGSIDIMKTIQIVRNQTCFEGKLATLKAIRKSIKYSLFEDALRSLKCHQPAKYAYADILISKNGKKRMLVFDSLAESNDSGPQARNFF